MRNGLGQPDLLAHAFAVARDFSPRRIAKLYAFERLNSQFNGLGLAHSVEDIARKKHLK